MDPFNIAIITLTAVSGYKTYQYWERKQRYKAEREEQSRIREQQARIYEQQQETARLEAEKEAQKRWQWRNIELKIQEDLKQRKLRETQWRTEYLMENMESQEHPQEYQPNSPEMEEELLKMMGWKN